MIPDLKVASARALRWSVGWQGVLDDILATYPITSNGSEWQVSSPFGHGFSSPDYKKAVGWAVDDFMGKLHQIAARSSAPRLAEAHVAHLANDVLASFNVDAGDGRAMAIRLLEEYAADPSRQNQAEMSDWGVNTFREDLGKIPDTDQGKLLGEERTRVQRARLTPDAAGLLAYLRVNRSGGIRMSRKQKVGLFVHMVAKGWVR